MACVGREKGWEMTSNQILSRALDNICRQIGGSDRWEEVKKIQLGIAKLDLEKGRR